MDGATALTQLRWTRSDPPGEAAHDDHRRATYSAALQQFEELIETARVAGPASQPLPLFYALSQAGRAIVAAHGECPDVHGHGLSQPRGEDKATPLVHRRIGRKANRDGKDAFGAVARATRSGDFRGEVELGAVWVANPHSPRLPLKYWRPEWRLSLFVDENPRVPADVDLHEHAKVLRVMPFAEPMAATADHGPDVGSGRYPTVPPSAGAPFWERQIDEDRTWNAFVVWRADEVPLDQVAPRAAFGDDRYLVPLLPGQEKLLSPLLLWWVLLFGFSVYARYQPELWVRTLDVDRSSVAVGIEHLLKQALDWVPRLVYEAALGNFYPVPKSHRLD